MGMGGGGGVKQSDNIFLPPSTAPIRASKESSFGMVTEKYVMMEAQASTIEGGGGGGGQAGKNDRAHGSIFWTVFHQNPPCRTTCMPWRALPSAGWTPTCPTVSIQEKF
jgi:hypothetical protein